MLSVVRVEQAPQSALSLMSAEAWARRWVCAAVNVGAEWMRSAFVPRVSREEVCWKTPYCFVGSVRARATLAAVAAFFWTLRAAVSLVADAARLRFEAILVVVEVVGSGCARSGGGVDCWIGGVVSEIAVVDSGTAVLDMVLDFVGEVGIVGRDFVGRIHYLRIAIVERESSGFVVSDEQSASGGESESIRENDERCNWVSAVEQNAYTKIRHTVEPEA